MLNRRDLTTISSAVAKILREEREKRQMSMTTVASKAGLSQQMISYVERGARNPTLDTLLRITGALEVDLSRIIARAAKQKARKPY